MRKALVAVSGGLDSTVALAEALRTCDEVGAVHFTYGSKHEESETMALRDVLNAITPHGFVTRHVDLRSIFMHAKSALLVGGGKIPDEEYHDIVMKTPSVTVVPFRNGIFLGVMAMIAESEGFSEIWMANHATDALGYAYPDCTIEFMQAMMKAIGTSSLGKVQLITPFQFMTKAEVVQMGVVTEAPLDLTYSCYRGGEFHCGHCPTCLERKKAFKDANVLDPTVYVEA